MFAARSAGECARWWLPSRATSANGGSSAREWPRVERVSVRHASSKSLSDATLPSLPPLTISLFMFLLTQTNTQGRVRTRTVKRASRHIIERFYARLTLDFDTNKRVCDEIAVIQSKRLRNKIAGFTTVRDRPRAH